MRIRFWGVRGSIPVSGREYLKYGGDTTCVEIRTAEDEIIIIDAGTGIRKLGNKLLGEGRSKYNMLFTHSHWDHILGFPFFKPIYVEGTHINMLGCPSAQDSIRQMLARTMVTPNFPVNFEDVKAGISYHDECRKSFRIKSVTITPILLSHTNGGVGYKFVEGDKCFVFLTDNELSFKHRGGLDYQDYRNFARGADLLIHDSEYTEEEYKTKKTWGHTIYKDSLKLAMEAPVRRFGLFHHNQERTDEDLDRIVMDCRDIIENNKSDLECFAASQEMEIDL